MPWGSFSFFTTASVSTLPWLETTTPLNIITAVETTRSTIIDLTTQGLGVDKPKMKALGLGQVLMNEKLDFLSNKEVLLSHIGL